MMELTRWRIVHHVVQQITERKIKNKASHTLFIQVFARLLLFLVLRRVFMRFITSLSFCTLLPFGVTTVDNLM